MLAFAPNDSQYVPKQIHAALRLGVPRRDDCRWRLSSALVISLTSGRPGAAPLAFEETGRWPGSQPMLMGLGPWRDNRRVSESTRCQYVGEGVARRRR
jgi:hypothetical protein